VNKKTARDVCTPINQIEPDIETALKRTIAAYRELASKYVQRWDDFRNDKVMKRFVSLLAEPKNVLDLASGTGRDLRLFQEYGINAVGVDLSPHMLKTSEQSSVNDRVCVADIRRLPFPERRFDGIWASACLLHFPRSAVSTFFQEIARVSEGIVFISLVEGQGHSWAKAPNNTARFFAYYSQREIRELLNAFEFSIIDMWNPNPPEDYPLWLYVLARKLTK
jgi:ubiquinone/menaquinone biosynthesis C-methylase UbiE